MLPRESITKTKFFFHKTLENLKSFFHGEYKKLPRSFSFNPLSSLRSVNADTYTSEQFYHEFYDQWQSELKRLKMIDEDNNNDSIIMSPVSKPKEPEMEKAAEFAEGLMVFYEEEDKGKEKKTKENVGLEKGNGRRARINDLVEKMKESEMMEVDDVEHLLDIEEALHYYSRLKCPLYLDVVDKFFMEMITEFSVPPRLPESKNS